MIYEVPFGNQVSNGFAFHNDSLGKGGAEGLFDPLRVLVNRMPDQRRPRRDFARQHFHRVPSVQPQIRVEEIPSPSLPLCGPDAISEVGLDSRP